MVIKVERRVVVDTRGQAPWFTWAQVNGFKVSTRREALPTGDYSLDGRQHVALVERKSMDGRVGCAMFGRDRFERELARRRDETEQPWLFIEGSRQGIDIRAAQARTVSCRGQSGAAAVPEQCRTTFMPALKPNLPGPSISEPKAG